LQEALTAVAAVSPEYYQTPDGIVDINSGIQSQVLGDLAPHLSGALLPKALIVAAAISDEEDRAEALTGLAPCLSGALLPEALTVAADISDERYRAEALTGLVPHLPETLKDKAMREALTAAADISDEYSRAQALIALTPQLTKAPLPIVDQLRVLDNRERRHLLQFLGTPGLFEPSTSVISSPTVAEIADHIIRICNKWEWM
jgi:hypothetical protein